MPGRIEFDFSSSPPPRRRHSSTLRILLLGDFSGRGSRRDGNPTDPASRPRLPLDVDRLEVQLQRLAPRLRLALPEGEVELTFEELDDFHPDALYRRLPLFQTLREGRRRLADPGTFRQAAADLGLSSTPAPQSGSGQPPPSPLEELLGGRPVGSSAGVAAATVDSLIRAVVGPHLLPDTQGQDQYLAAVDAAIAAQMRQVLHHPHFQALESAWRGVAELTRRLETGPELQLFLLDMTREELVRDLLEEGAEPGRSALHQLLVEDSPEPWSLIAGHYTFGADETDIRLLAALGAVAGRAGGPFLGAASPRLLGVESLERAPDPAHWPGPDDTVAPWWQALRESPVASWVGLLLPRVLLRLPYGRRTDPIDSFDFEEIPAAPRHRDLLWGNPAFAAVGLLAEAFLDQGGGPELAGGMERDGLPAYSYELDGEATLQPVAEVRLGERAAVALLEAGLMPLVGRHQGTSIRLPRWQSLAATPLAGF